MLTRLRVAKNTCVLAILFVLGIFIHNLRLKIHSSNSLARVGLDDQRDNALMRAQLKVYRSEKFSLPDKGRTLDKVSSYAI